MITQRKRRLYFIILLVVAVSAATGLLLVALKENVNLYFTPSQALEKGKKVPPGHLFRLGGMVVVGSVRHVPNSLQVYFSLTDYRATVPVIFTGILPALFREGQGIVALGQFNQQGKFVAQQVLAKHDEKYKPPSIPVSISKVKVRSFAMANPNFHA